MAIITLLTHVVATTRGDFFAAKKLIFHLLTLGHQIEWILKIDKPQIMLPLPMDDLPLSECFRYYYLDSTAANKDILANKTKLAERDYFIIFPTIETMGTDELLSLRGSGVNIKVVGEYGQDQGYFNNLSFRSNISFLRQYQIPHYFTGPVLKDQIISSSQAILVVDDSTFERAFSRTYYNQLFPFFVKQEHTNMTTIYGLDHRGSLKLTQVNKDNEALYAGSQLDFHSGQAYSPLTNQMKKHLQLSQAHTQQSLGMFMNPIADSPDDAIALLFAADKDKPFMRLLLGKRPDAEITPLDIIQYNQSTATLFAYTNTDLVIFAYCHPSDKDILDYQLANYFAFGIRRMMQSPSPPKKIDLIGRHSIRTKEFLIKILKKQAINLQDVELRLFNPFPLAHQTMQAFFKKAKIDKQPMLITGDQSLNEVINIGAPFMYQICHWKQSLAKKLLELCNSLGYKELHNFLYHSFTGDISGVTRFDQKPTEIFALINNPILYEQYTFIRQHIPSIYDNLQTVVLDKLEVKSHDVQPLNFAVAFINEDKIASFQRERQLCPPATICFGTIDHSQIAVIPPAEIKEVAAAAPPKINVSHNNWWSLTKYIAGRNITEEEVVLNLQKLQPGLERNVFLGSYPDQSIPGVTKNSLRKKLGEQIISQEPPSHHSSFVEIDERIPDLEQVEPGFIVRHDPQPTSSMSVQSQKSAFFSHVPSPPLAKVRKYHYQDKSGNILKIDLTQSSFSDEQIEKIKSRITCLDKELNGKWPYPNKSKKAQKIQALLELLGLSTQTTIMNAIYTITERFPHVRDGKHSETASLLDELNDTVNKLSGFKRT